MRGFDRDLRRANGIMAAARGRAASQVEHMAAPTRAVQKLQKILANDGPSTHGLFIRLRHTEEQPSGALEYDIWARTRDRRGPNVKFAPLASNLVIRRRLYPFACVFGDDQR